MREVVWDGLLNLIWEMLDGEFGNWICVDREVVCFGSGESRIFFSLIFVCIEIMLNKCGYVMGDCDCVNV